MDMKKCTVQAALDDEKKPKGWVDYQNVRQQIQTIRATAFSRSETRNDIKLGDTFIEKKLCDTKMTSKIKKSLTNYSNEM